MAQRGRPKKVAVATPATRVASDIKAINKIKVASRFNGTMAVDADYRNDVITIGYVPLLGNPVSVTLTHPTFADFGNAIEKITTDSHENVKALVKADAANLILKALTVSSNPLADQVAKSHKDAKEGIAFNTEIKDVAAAKVAHKAELEAAKADIEAELASL